jgi:hypothetical protein
MPAKTPCLQNMSPTAKDHVPDKLQHNFAEWFHYLRPDNNPLERERYEGHIGDVDAFYLDFKLRPDGTYKSIGDATLVDFEFDKDLLISLNDKAGHYRVVEAIDSEGGGTFYNLYDKKTDSFVANLGSITFEFTTPGPFVSFHSSGVDVFL